MLRDDLIAMLAEKSEAFGVNLETMSRYENEAHQFGFQ